MSSIFKKVLIFSSNFLSVSLKEDHTDFNLPGGKVEQNETFEEAAIREVKEETGLDEEDEMNSDLRNLILEYLSSINSYLLVGAEAFNMFYLESGINKDYIKNQYKKYFFF